MDIQHQSQTIEKLAKSLIKVQKQLKPAKRSQENPFFKSKYADLTDVWETVREPLATNGLCVVQHTEMREGQLVLVTKLIHESGEWIEGLLPVKPVKEDPQGLTMCITYLRRSGLSSIVGVTTEDDDGNTASNTQAQHQPQQSQEQPKEMRKPGVPAKPQNPISTSNDQWVVPFGKWKGVKYADIPLSIAVNYAGYLEAEANKQDKEVEGAAKEFVDRTYRRAEEDQKQMEKEMGDF